MKTWLLAIVGLLQACSSGDIPNFVNEEDYADIKLCWERNGKFQSLVVIHEEEGRLYPYYISPWCDVSTEYYPKGLGFIRHIKALQFDGDDGILQRAVLFDRSLESTTPVHTPLPQQGDPIYIYIGSIKNLKNEDFIYYRISNPEKFKPIKLNFGEFIKKTPDIRLKIFKENS